MVEKLATWRNMVVYLFPWYPRYDSWLDNDTEDFNEEKVVISKSFGGFSNLAEFKKRGGLQALPALRRIVFMLSVEWTECLRHETRSCASFFATMALQLELRELQSCKSCKWLTSRPVEYNRQHMLAWLNVGGASHLSTKLIVVSGVEAKSWRVVNNSYTSAHTSSDSLPCHEDYEAILSEAPSMQGRLIIHSKRFQLQVGFTFWRVTASSPHGLLQLAQ